MSSLLNQPVTRRIRMTTYQPVELTMDGSTLEHLVYKLIKSDPDEISRESRLSVTNIVDVAGVICSSLSSS